jgi:TonB family protein
MRGSVFGSGVVHALLVAVLLVIRHPVKIVVPGPDVIQVALVEPDVAVAPPAPAPAPPVVEKPAVKPTEDTGVKLSPPKVKKTPQPEKRVEPPPKTESAAPSLPAERVGAAGLRGDVSVDMGNFEYTYYLVLIRNRIAANWSPPAGISTGGNRVRVVVYFRVGRGGELSDVRIESVSGVEFFDRSALRAVTLSDPMPPLPLGFAGGDLGVHFGFEWESP